MLKDGKSLSDPLTVLRVMRNHENVDGNLLLLPTFQPLKVGHKVSVVKGSQSHYLQDKDKNTITIQFQTLINYLNSFDNKMKFRKGIIRVVDIRVMDTRVYDPGVQAKK